MKSAEPGSRDCGFFVVSETLFVVFLRIALYNGISRVRGGYKR